MDSEPLGLTGDQVAYYRQVLAIHARHGGTCPVCGVARCPDWLAAFDTLAAAHQTMSDPEQWDGSLPPRHQPADAAHTPLETPNGPQP